MKLQIMTGEYSVYRFDDDANIPIAMFKENDFISLTKTKEELSLVCRSGMIKGEGKEEKEWKMLKIKGPLDFGMIGVISSISGPLAEAKISVFVVSTYDTDYVMVKKDRLREAMNVLTGKGLDIEDE